MAPARACVWSAEPEFHSRAGKNEARRDPAKGPVRGQIRWTIHPKAQSQSQREEGERTGSETSGKEQGKGSGEESDNRKEVFFSFAEEDRRKTREEWERDRTRAKEDRYQACNENEGARNRANEEKNSLVLQFCLLKSAFTKASGARGSLASSLLGFLNDRSTALEEF